MKNDLVQLVLALLALVIGGAAEELLPKIAGTGFPVLMAASVYFATRRRAADAVAFALAAGALEDALGGLPPATSPSFFLAATALARWSAFPRGAFILAYPVYRMWLGLWTAGAAGGMFGSVLVAVPAGVTTAFAVWALLGWAERKAAVDAA